MSSYSAVNCQWDESLSRLCVLEPQPHSANRPDRRKAWASGETKPTLMKCVQVEKALAGPKNAWILVLFLHSSAACLCVNQATSLLGIRTVQVSFAGISSAPAIQAWCRRLARFVAAVSAQACASSRDCSSPWLEGLAQVISMIPFIWRAQWVTHVMSSYLLPSPDQPFWVAFTAHCHWGPVTRRVLQRLWLSGSDPVLSGNGWDPHPLLRMGEDHISAESFWTPCVLESYSAYKA